MLGEEFKVRPQLALIVQGEAVTTTETGQSLNIFVCGLDTMQNDVRNAVAKENLNYEHFLWA